MISPPVNEQELLARANLIAGYTLGEVASYLNITVPADLKRDKGWVGNLLETYLGAKAGSKPEQDFAHLGIELKTIPVDAKGHPLETTFICVAPLMANHGVTWDSSHVKYKLQKVLWIPVEGERTIRVAERRVGSAILWSPDSEQENILKQDWQELMDMIVLGQIEKVTARQGEVLQIRPKAANGQALTEAIGEDGNIILTRPRGFYLRKQFTADILHNYVRSKMTSSGS
ncbi:DNA mismatch repair endonuclease MutH [Zophobihabitans entericus]|uniref:DNA mismatch repair protein MutH n=1 Tax=Zophobihabitans entericus TaxID=1635327 RepID=A0A6G9I9P5_9GAMM|nr:DNA mismatch repair endonuclease MutH [Zophobihabitans entericus]QIQ20300.1 DNA mismatch repair endonuclease MutH [Zophobihabitans entericus]